MQRVGFVLFDGFHVMTFAAMAVFEVVNETLEEPRYDVRLLSERGGFVRSSVGALVQTEPFDEARFDTLIVGGGEASDPTPGMIDFVRKAPEVARRVASTCVGAFSLRKRVFSTGDARPRIGCLRAVCGSNFPASRSRKIVFSSKTKEFGLRPE
jgi:transcriptional regulator GlxA family with amidase domain